MSLKNLADAELHSGDSDEDDSDYVPEEEDDIEEEKNPEFDDAEDDNNSETKPTSSETPPTVDEKAKKEDAWNKFLTTEVTSPAEIPETTISQTPAALILSASPVLDSSADASSKSSLPVINKDKSPITIPPKKRGLDSLLNSVKNKKSKMSVLEKSALDWKSFKEDEGITEDLQTFNKGKQGFLERQAFLLRSDHRSFEVEKSLRLSKK